MSRTSLVLGVVGLWIGAVAAVAIAEDSGKPDQAAMEQMMQAAMTPGDHHKANAKMAGDWVTTSKFWMDPSTPPMESTGTAHFDVIMNGLFVNEVAQSPMMGMPWEGRGTFGYDNQTKKHTSTWHDSFGSGILMFEGECKDNCGAVTMYSNEYMDPMEGKKVRMKTVANHADANHVHLELYVVDGSAEKKMGEIDYTRKM